MQHLLKLRWRSQWPMYGGILLCGVAASSGFLYYIPALRQTPDRAIAIIGLCSFALLWFYDRFILAFERQEGRPALLVSLPLPVSRIAWARALSTLMGPVALTAALLLMTGLGRLIIGSPQEEGPLQLMVFAASLVMLCNQLHLLWQELQARGGIDAFNRVLWGSLYLGLLLFLLAALWHSAGSSSGQGTWRLNLLQNGAGTILCLLVTCTC